jgi:hypothetical protein
MYRRSTRMKGDEYVKFINLRERDLGFLKFLD